LQKDRIGKADRERVKLAGRQLYDSLRRLIAERERWTEKEQAHAEVETLILDQTFLRLRTPPFSDNDKQAAVKRIYAHVWQQSASDAFT
jgi:type I restriction enzyme, R subunit